MTANAYRLLVRRDNLRETRIEAATPAAQCDLGDGQLRLKVERFALTANNITYAAFGDAMKYWQFYPADETWGCVPVWGFATVLESRAEGVAVGERLYGYLPMATHAVLQAGRVGPLGFTDTSAHREGLAAVYNQYQRCASDPGYRADFEPYQALLRPLFATSFLIDDFLAESKAFGAQQVLMSSASSKTAYGTAYCIGQRGAAGWRRVGLTSRANLAFTKSLGCFDEALEYGELATMAANVPTLFIDFAGDAKLRRAVHEHFGDALTYSCAVGGTHWQELGSGAGLPGPRPVLFFAPAQAKQRAAPPPEGWGPAGLAQRIGQALNGFAAQAAAAMPRWIEPVEAHGPEAMGEAYTRLLEGRVEPRVGLMLAP